VAPGILLLPGLRAPDHFHGGHVVRGHLRRHSHEEGGEEVERRGEI